MFTCGFVLTNFSFPIYNLPVKAQAKPGRK